ncbi:hypothetical protein [Dactylosporangium sp. CA-092794]|uniref:hypothetical protein n=1 Tax=Dactylosporangium sp. CA-092794 TaxID=3239929 RepID=UPI003D8EBB7D
MLQALFHFGGTTGESLILAYLLGGVVTFAAAFLPGNVTLYRVVCLILGAVMAVWAAKVLLFGGTLIVTAFALLAPVALLLIGAVGAVRVAFGRSRSGSATRLPPPRPHPAARQFGGPESYLPHPPAAYPQDFPPRPRAVRAPAEHPAAGPRHAAHVPAPRMEIAPLIEPEPPARPPARARHRAAEHRA